MVVICDRAKNALAPRPYNITLDSYPGISYRAHYSSERTRPSWSGLPQEFRGPKPAWASCSAAAGSGGQARVELLGQEAREVGMHGAVGVAHTHRGQVVQCL